MMKYIKLFENFNPENFGNFRFKLINPGMSEGRYLTTFAGIDGDSYFGVFNLEGLRSLEDSMNTESICAGLWDLLEDDGSQQEELFGLIVTNPVSAEVKYLVVTDGEDSIDFLNANPEGLPELEVDSEGKLKNINRIGLGYFIEPVVELNDQQKELGDKGDLYIYPAKLNVLYTADFYLYNIEGTTDYYKAFDKHIGYGQGLVQDSTIEQVEPFIPEIIEKGMPKGFLKRLEELKNK